MTREEWEELDRRVLYAYYRVAWSPRDQIEFELGSGD